MEYPAKLLVSSSPLYFSCLILPFKDSALSGNSSRSKLEPFIFLVSTLFVLARMQDISEVVVLELEEGMARETDIENEYKDEVIPVYSLEAEFTRPLWVFGISSYDFLGDEERHSIVCSYRLNGRSYLGILNDVDGSYSALDTPFTDVGNVVVGSNCLFIEGASASHAVSVVKITLDSNNKQVPLFSVIWSSSTDAAKYKSYFSLPEIVKFPTGTGEDAYAYFYSPSNPDYQAPVDEKPPLIVKSHGWLFSVLGFHGLVVSMPWLLGSHGGLLGGFSRAWCLGSMQASWVSAAASSVPWLVCFP
ncbi:hypothetical protein MA16_Dca024337 [Dendrobium catenatum]|uniref:Uncharacterized protein n=1 Tax=Dendrobium catenatum TaxID=906689 RepID=A0A2I0XHE7_9ASPA|nr:hypothetical protein MA16_Dca024337 [Dendrobium catenatum]